MHNLIRLCGSGTSLSGEQTRQTWIDGKYGLDRREVVETTRPHSSSEARQLIPFQVHQLTAVPFIDWPDIATPKYACDGSRVPGSM